MDRSAFGNKFGADSGILQLMGDLGAAMSSAEKTYMLGGGNPARIPAVEQLFRERMIELLDDGTRFERTIGEYDGPQGHSGFIDALAELLRSELGWPITPANIALTNGSQTAFFILFNIFAGKYENRPDRRVLLPLAPEYIGYADIGIDRELFVASRPSIDHLDEHIFKYRIDADALAQIDQAEDIGAICVSRPTNPTGNVLTDTEIDQLSNLARQRGIPLIIDSAYGTPFPNIIFTDATPIWDKGIIVTMSLSKLGLPGLRTGIVIADEDVIRSVTGANAILSLATGSIGPALAEGLVRSGTILEVSRRHIQPFYKNRADDAMQWLSQYMDGVPYRVHTPEGAIFLWLWFPDLPIDSETLYQRLKQRRVLVIAGHHFFPGLHDDWRHRYECIRVTYSQDPDTVREGIRIIAEEVRQAYAEGVSSAAANS